MKLTRQKLRVMTAAAGICLAAVIAVNVFGYIFDCRHVSIFAAAQDADKYEVRSRLLTEAMREVGVCSAHGAAAVWAKGVESRSGAMQYSVMSAALKIQYAKQLEKNAPNWVTGVSSPWIEDYSIESVNESDGCSIMRLVFLVLSSTGPAGEYEARLTIIGEDGFWRIESIDAEPGLSPYMGAGG